MKIGVILDTEITMDQRVLNEIKILHQYGHEIYVLCPNINNLSNHEEINIGHIQRFNMSSKQKNILFSIQNTLPFYEKWWTHKIKDFIQNTDIKALHVHDLYMARAAAHANQHSKLPITLDLHENFPAAIRSYTWATQFPRNLLVQPGKWEKLELAYLRCANNIIVLCESFRDQLLHKYPELSSKRFIIYPNVPDIDELLSKPINQNVLDKKKDDFLLFYFGVIGVRRGLLTCFEALKKVNKHIKLLIIGPIDKADKKIFETYMNDPQLTDRIIYHRWKNMDEFPSFVSLSDVGISPLIRNPQHESGIANKVFQYMLFAKPILVSNCAPQEELVKKGLCGYSFESENIEDLASKIDFLYQNPSLCQEMGFAGKKIILEQYNTNIIGENLATIYNS